MNKRMLLLVLLSFLIIPGIVLAQGPVEKMVGNVMRMVIFVSGGIVVIIWAVAGVLFLSSQGDPSGLTKAKTALFAAIGGTILVTLAASAQAIISSVIFRGV